MIVELIFASLMNAVNFGDSRLTLDYCAELVTNAFRLTPSARRKDTADSLLAGGSKACLIHFNGPSKHWHRSNYQSI